MAYKGSITDRVSIDERPAIAEKKQHSGALLTLVERKSRFAPIAPVDSKHADHVAEVLIDTLQDLKAHIQILTVDNGNECAQHQQVQQALQAEGYFPTPIAPESEDSARIPMAFSVSIFTKGSTLKTSRRLRPDKRNRLDDRPRKELGFRSSNEVFYTEKTRSLYVHFRVEAT